MKVMSNKKLKKTEFFALFKICVNPRPPGYTKTQIYTQKYTKIQIYTQKQTPFTKKSAFLVHNYTFSPILSTDFRASDFEFLIEFCLIFRLGKFQSFAQVIKSKNKIF